MIPAVRGVWLPSPGQYYSTRCLPLADSGRIRARYEEDPNPNCRIRASFPYPRRCYPTDLLEYRCPKQQQPTANHRTDKQSASVQLTYQNLISAREELESCWQCHSQRGD